MNFTAQPPLLPPWGERARVPLRSGRHVARGQQSERAGFFALVAVLLPLFVAGCVSLPPFPLGQGTSQEALAETVKFLSQPALKGRAPGTPGSRIARRYIESRFKACGLVPWGRQQGFEISFGRGRNVVGVLPGSDPNLASEIVLVSAHYDHLGRDGKGRICPGAADDASGVAVLLEAAGDLSRLEPKPRRSICFVAFDCEETMLFGSFAFSCREDVAAANIAAVVNLDILGRDFLDVVRNTVFVAGAEHYPELREQLRRLGTQAGIRVLPVGTDLIGPRGDHAAFEARPIPCLFFSSGLYRDYHKPTDTADKLDYDELGRSANVVLSAVKELAGGPGFKRSDKTRDAEAEELTGVTAVMSEVVTNCDQAGVSREEAAEFTKLAQAAGRLLQDGGYDQQKRAEFIVGATGILAPSLLGLEQVGSSRKDQERKETVQTLQYVQAFYIRHRVELLEGYRKLVAHILKYRPGPFRGMPPFEYEVCDVTDEDIRFVDRGDGTCALNVLLTPMTLRAEARRSKWLLPSFGFWLFGGVNGIDGEGTREQITDLCLLNLRREQTNRLHSTNIARVLRVVAGSEPGSRYRELLAERLQRGGFASEADWIANGILSGVPELSLEAISADADDKSGVIRQAISKVITDKTVRPDVRALAIERAKPKRDRRVLLALCAVVAEGTPAFTKDCWAMLRPAYPFADRLEVRQIRPQLEELAEHLPNYRKTIGDLARAQLKKATRRDFGTDTSQWQAWVEAKTAR